MGVPEPPPLSMNFGTLNRGKPEVPEGGERCLASRRSDCLRGFAGSPMMSLERSPDVGAPPCFPPGTPSRGPWRTAGGLCPLLSPLCLQTPTPRHPKALVGWVGPRSWDVNPPGLQGMRAHGSGQPGVDPCCVCPIPVLAHLYPPGSPQAGGTALGWAFFLGQVWMFSSDSLPCAAPDAGGALFTPSSRGLQLGHQHHPSCSASWGHPRVLHNPFFFSSKVSSGISAPAVLWADEESRAAEGFFFFFFLMSPISAVLSL